jgi:RND family efflux transporter MFP subunit
MRPITRTIRILAILGLLGGIGWGGKRISGFPKRSEEPAQASADLLDTAAVRQGEFLVTVAATGRLEAHQTTQVYGGLAYGGGGQSQGWGGNFAKVTFVAEDGSSVKKGDVLFRFDDADFRRDFREKELAYENSKAEILKTERDRDLELKKAQADAEKIKEELRILKETDATQIRLGEAQVSYDESELARVTRQFEQKKRQAEEGLIPRVQFDVANDQLRAAQFEREKSLKELAATKEKTAATEQQKQTDLDAALFVVESAGQKVGNETGAAKAKTAALKSALDLVQQQIDQCTIRSPADGLLVLSNTWHPGGNDGQRPTKVGDQVFPRSQIAEIPDLSRMQVICKVPERDMGPIRAGQQALIRLDEMPDQPFHGRVKRVGSIAEEIDPEDSSSLVAGTRVFNVTLDLAEKDSTHLVPGMSATVEFVTARLPRAVYVPRECVFEEGDTHVVYVRNRNRFVKTRVTAGAENGQFDEIKQGLKRGMEVARQRPLATEEKG